MPEKRKPKPLMYIVQPKFDKPQATMQESFSMRGKPLPKDNADDGEWVLVEKSDDKKEKTKEVVKKEKFQEVKETKEIQQVKEIIEAKELKEIKEVKEVKKVKEAEKVEIKISEPVIVQEEPRLELEIPAEQTPEIEVISVTSAEEITESAPIVAAAATVDVVVEEVVSESEDIRREKRKEIWSKIMRLAHYPKVIDRPFCEAIVNDKTMKFQVESKRGDKVKVRVGNRIMIINIDDISELNILDWRRR